LVGGPESTDMAAIEDVREIILEEVNVRAIEYVADSAHLVRRSAKANFKKLGARLGKQMKAVAAVIAAMDSDAVGRLLSAGSATLLVEGESVSIEAGELEILSEEIGAWLVAQEGTITVALDTTLTAELLEQGIAREIVRCVQSLRKKADLALTDRIHVEFSVVAAVAAAIERHHDYIVGEVLALSLSATPSPAGEVFEQFEVGEGEALIALKRA